MATITLTTSPQSIANSNLGCILKAEDTFLYGFGSSAPSEGIEGNPSEPLDYGGAYGLLWVWRDTLEGSENVTYFVGALV